MNTNTKADSIEVADQVERPDRPISCSGACEAHDGEHRLVRVTDPANGIDWGLFWYCDEAKRIDQHRGLTVEDA